MLRVALFQIIRPVSRLLACKQPLVEIHGDRLRTAEKQPHSELTFGVEAYSDEVNLDIVSRRKAPLYRR